MRVLFVVLPERGHYNTSLYLAKRLRARGHTAVFVAPRSYADEVEALGFDAHVVREERPPNSQSDALAESIALRDALAKGALEATTGHPEDVVLIDSALADIALTVLPRARRVMSLCTTLSVARHDRYPPLTSRALYRPDALGALRSRVSWLGRDLMRLRSLAGPGAFDEMAHFRRLAREAGVSQDAIRGGEFGARVASLPELVLCSAAFDLPRPHGPLVHHAGPCVDLERPELPLDPPLHDDKAPLVVCSFGTRPIDTERSARLIKTVIEAFRSLPQLTLAMATGSAVVPSRLEPLPPNVHLYERLPLLGCLSRAKLFITHGGLNSIKESIYFGVPMIVLPLQREQPGNACRVHFHRLGRTADADRTTNVELRRLVVSTLDDRLVGDAISAMSTLFRREQAEEKWPEVVEHTPAVI